MYEDYSFSITTRDEHDLAVIRKPSWWTRERLQAIGGILAIIVAATVLWGVALQMKVREQTLVISEKIEKGRISEERIRIAQELHDTLQQELVGVGLQLDNAAARLSRAPHFAAESIELARAMLRQSQADARRSIWEIHSEGRLCENLATRLRSIVSSLKADSGPKLVVTTDDDIPNIPASIASQYFRIAQEALVNAIKHANANAICVRLFRDNDELHLQVQDDGVGFCLETISGVSDGHLGLSSMRQRARKLAGTFKIDSKPGEGTVVSLVTRIDAIRR